ncbi:MAG: SDR family oxidoreductase [Bacteroidota bacterium]
MVKEFQNQWAIILGGSSGMGLATAHQLANRGMNLCIVHRDRRKEAEVFQKEVDCMVEGGIEVMCFNVDALRSEKRKMIIQNLKDQLGESGRIKLLLHSISRGNLKLLAPIPNSAPDSELKEAFSGNTSYLQLSDFQATLEAMALSLYDWVFDLFQAQLFSEEARVLGLTSEGSSKAWRSYAAVSVAKASLEAICRSIALEFAPYGITCNILQPGVTDTPSLRMIPGSKTLLAHTKDRNPKQRLTKPDDVAKVIYLLCRPEANWINGAIIPVDGGESMA